jgi:threonine 3-dehydrogenase
VITDINPWRLDMALKMGATRAVNVNAENLKDALNQLGLTEGFTVGLEMSGAESAFRGMIATMSNGGKIALLGIPPGGRMDIDWNQVIFKSLFIKGIYGREMYETWHKMAAMLQSGLNIAPVITHRIGIDDFQSGFEAMLSGQCGKVVMDWGA